MIAMILFNRNAPEILKQDVIFKCTAFRYMMKWNINTSNAIFCIFDLEVVVLKMLIQKVNND